MRNPCTYPRKIGISPNSILQGPSGELGIAVEATQDKINPEVGHQDGHKRYY